MKQNKVKLIGAVLLLINGLAISLIAGGVSVYGMTILFSGHALIVALMIASMEFGKLSAATWLKFNWGNRKVSRLQKSYLLTAVIVISALTDIGLFGFLSAAHLEQNSPLAGLGIQAQQYQTQLDQKIATNKRIEGRLTQIDTNINAFLTNGAASKGLKASATLKAERDALQKQADENNQLINDLNTKLAPLKQKSTEVEAKLGPVKFLATTLGYKDAEVAVRMVIILIMIAFDPLAVILILSSMTTFREINDHKDPIVLGDVVEQPLPEMEVVEASVNAEPLITSNITVEASEPVEPLLVSVAAEPMIVANITAEAFEPVVEPLLASVVAEPLIVASITAEASEPVVEPRFGEMLSSIPVYAVGGAVTNAPVTLTPREIADKMAEPVPAPVPEMDDKEIRNLLIDLMEQHPDIVSDLLATAKEMEVNPTISNVTGAVHD